MTYINSVKIYLILLLSISIKTLNAQSVNISKYIETVTLDTDRDIYMNGEEIFYSVNYYLNNIQKQPTFSNIIYVELINCANNKPVIQKKIKLLNYKANDIIKIPSNIVSGNYILRTYTIYQRNFSDYSFAYHLITILNPNNNKYPLIYNEKLDSVEIITENGILLENAINNILIKIPNKIVKTHNKYFITEGNLIKKEINFSKYGFSQNELFIKQNETYKLQIIKNNEDTLYIPFPKTKQNGLQTTTSWINQNIIYKIKQIGINTENKTSYKISVISQNYSIKHTENVNLIDPEKSLILPLDIFDTGINYIVLFNYKDKIISINTIYKSKRKVNAFNIETEKNIFNTNENVNVSFSLKEKKDSQFSEAYISVILDGTKKSNYNFAPELYLSNPLILEDYLQNLDEDNKKLEQRVVTLFNNHINIAQFSKKIKKSSTTNFQYVPDIRDVTLRGVLSNTTTNEPIKNKDVFLSVLFNTPQVHVNTTNDKGEFIFSLNNIKGVNDVFISSHPEENNPETKITIENPFSSNMPNFGVLPTFFDKNNENLIKKLYINSQINKYAKVDSISKNSNRRKVKDFNINYDKKTVFIKDFIKLKSVEEFFFELIPSVKIKKTANSYKFNIYDDNGNMLRGEPLLLIDNIPFFDFSKIQNIKISKVEKISVINSKYYLGTHIFYGVIMITTKTSDFAGLEFPKYGVFLNYKGVEQHNEKYNLFSENIHNFKTLLYWNPNFNISNKKEEINFKTSYSKGTYNIFIKAYNEKGEVFYGKKQIIVK